MSKSIKGILVLVAVLVVGFILTGLVKGTSNGNSVDNTVKSFAYGLEEVTDNEINLAEVDNGIDNVIDGISNLFSGAKDRAAQLIDVDKITMTSAQ
jgi:hypothetical protein